MRLKLWIGALAMMTTMSSLSAHVMVSPTQSKSGVTQRYEVRVHNEAKVAATSIEVEIPDGVVVLYVEKSLNGNATTTKVGDRITSIAWPIDVQPSKYVALTFTAKNPDGTIDLHWTLSERLADGSTIDWSNKPWSKEKGSVTKLSAQQE